MSLIGNVVFVVLVIWAFFQSILLGIACFIVGAALIAWKYSLSKYLGVIGILISVIWGFSVGWVLGVIIIFICLFVVFAEMAGEQETEDMKAMIERLIEEENFNIDQRFNGYDHQSILLDTKTYRFAYINGSESYRIYKIEDIINLEIKEDDKQVVRSSHGVSASGAILGGAIGGGVGAVVGGLKRKYRVQEKVERITLRIVVNDTKAPTIDFDLFDGYSNRDSVKVEEAFEKAEELYNLLVVLMRNA